MAETDTLPPDRAEPHPGTDQFAWELPFPDEAARRAAWRDMLFHDEGLLRILYLNKARVSENAWRSGQPNPWHLKWFAGQGVKTVVSLRNGRNFGALPLEIEACHRLGMDFRVHVFRSRRLMPAENLLDFDRLLDEIEYPVLFHCKAGADRTSLASALYLMLKEGRPLEEARRQLSLRFGHLKGSDPGVLDAVFDAYERDHAETGIGLREWIATRYDPEAIQAEFEPKGLSRWLVDKVLDRE